MTEPKPDYVELKSKEPSPTTPGSSIELKVLAKSEKPRYVLYNWLASLAFIISIISLIFYLAFHFSGLLITFSALGTIAVGAGCFFSYLAISRIDPKKQTYAFIAFCLAAGLCFTTSIISLNMVFRDYKPIPNISFMSEPVPEPLPLTMPFPSPPDASSEPVRTPYTEPAYEPNIEPPYPEVSIDPVYPDTTGYTRYAPYGGYTSPVPPIYDYPYNYGNSYSSSSSYSNSYTYSYSDPYPYSITYSFSYSTSSSPYGSNYYVDTRTSYDNYGPYGQPSYSNQYSYSGSSNGYVTYDPADFLPLNSSIYGEPQVLENSTLTSEPVEELVTESVDEPTEDVDESNTNSSSPDSPVNNTNNASDNAKPGQDSNTTSISQNPSDSISVDPNVAHSSPVYYPPRVNDQPMPSVPDGNTGYAGYIPGYNPGYNPGYTSPSYNGYSSYSSSSSSSNSYTYSYSDPYPYSISYSYSYSTSDSAYGSSYSVFSSSNYDNYSPYGQPSYSNQYSYSSSSGNGGYPYQPYVRPLYAYPAYAPAYTTYEPYSSNYNSYNPDVDPSYAYTTYEPYSSNYNSYTPNVEPPYAYTTYEPYSYNSYGQDEAQAQSSFLGAARDGNVPSARFYKANNVHTSGTSSVTIALLVFLFVIKTLLFVALITQAHEVKNALKEGKQVVLEETDIKSESQII